VSESYVPDWRVPANVRALQTTRNGGVSHAPWASFNLGDHVGDAAQSVVANRALLRAGLPGEPVWLKQVHGTVAVDVDLQPKNAEGDAACSRLPGNVCAVMTADCLPVLFCDRAGSVVAAAHAGWRGLLAGVLESAVGAMKVDATNILAWLGPAIGAQCFEVGAEVQEAFIAADPSASLAFTPKAGDKWLCDIYLLARQRLQRLGITGISGGESCTVSEPWRFFSYRRDGVTGRMASLIWLERGASGV
jgi:purine-nucleoside/S-methyl-5'-thioadenosine phosphorylase / adenosine deaminase